MATKQEFIQKIRTKYPQYNNVEDDVLYNKIIDKYPTYKNQITDIQSEATQTPVEESDSEYGWESYTKTLLPIGGAIAGGILGGGWASPVTAGLGAAGGEALSQGISNIAHNRSGADLNKIALEGATGLAGEGVGKAIGSGFRFLAPKLGEVLARIPKKDYERVLTAEGFTLVPRMKKAIEGVSYEKKNLEKLPGIKMDQLAGIMEQVKGKYAGGGINLAAQKVGSPLRRTENALLDAAISSGDETVNPRALHEIKNSLQEASKYSNAIGQPIYKGSSNELLKDLASEYNNVLRGISPSYGQANKAFMDALAKQSFTKVKPPGLIGVGGLGYSMYNPQALVPSLTYEGLRQPFVHGIGVDLYKGLRNTGIGGGLGAYTGSFTE
jgi:hypothetical protein